eukprot:JP436936.1.p1 GENE.JP436936.1~~JP436936.1.p1  ORF type:complete len:208 (+),score=43.25 JP436936.1:71-625(+)
MLLSMDSFYRSLTDEECELAHRCEYNFDHPNAYDWDSFFKVLRELKIGNPVSIPIYDYVTHRVVGQQPEREANIVLLEGIFTFWDQRVVDILDLKLFVDTESDLRLVRRLRRDIAERGRDLESVLEQYEKYVRPSYEEFVHPTKMVADVIIPRGRENLVAINLVCDCIEKKLKEYDLRPRLKSL